MSLNSPFAYLTSNWRHMIMFVKFSWSTCFFIEQRHKKHGKVSEKHLIYCRQTKIKYWNGVSVQVCKNLCSSVGFGCLSLSVNFVLIFFAAAKSVCVLCLLRLQKKKNHDFLLNFSANLERVLDASCVGFSFRSGVRCSALSAAGRSAAYTKVGGVKSWFNLWPISGIELLQVM